MIDAPSEATALTDMVLDVWDKKLTGKYTMRDLANQLPSSTGPHVLSDETICCALHEVTSKNMENNKVLANSGGIET